MKPPTLDTPEAVADYVAAVRGWPEDIADDIEEALRGVSWDDDQELLDAARLIREDDDVRNLPGARKLAFLFEQAATMEEETLLDFLEAFARGVAASAIELAEEAQEAYQRPPAWMVAAGVGILLLALRR